jgi:hypothetical protein
MPSLPINYKKKRYPDDKKNRDPEKVVDVFNSFSLSIA